MKNFTFSRFLNVLLVLMILFLIGRYFYMQPKFIQGESSQEIISKLPSGEEFRLSDLKGNYVLLDFWGSWCGPCRKENPDLVKLYEKYKDVTFTDAEGFEIVSVGIERNRERWLRAIQADGLVWKYHISDLNRFDSEAAKTYGVREIPTKYLLDEKGVIIGVNLSAEEIDRLLEKRKG